MLPSRRLAALIVFSGLLFTLAPLLRPLLWVGIGLDVLLVAACAADWLLLRAADKVEARRELGRTLSLAAPNLVRLVVTNRAPRAFQVTLRDDPPPEFRPDADRFRFTLAPEETWSGSYHVVPPRRGDHPFGNLNLRFATPLGLLIRQRTVAAGEPARVYPDIRQVRQYEMLARHRRAAQMGVRRLRQLGVGLEFQQLRPYESGDEVRHLDWKAYARSGAPMVRQFAAERSQQVVLALDLGRTMATRFGELTKIDHALNACVLLGHIAAVSDDRLGLYTFGDTPGIFLAPRRGRQQQLRLIDALYPLEAATAETDYLRAFASLADRLGQRALIILFTDLVDPDSSRALIDAVTLLSRRHLVLCVAFGDHELAELTEEWPERAEDLYRQAVAASLLEDRQRALLELGRRGVLTLDATTGSLTADVVNRYLELRREGRG